MILWWYSGGIVELMRRIGHRFAGVADFFSIGLLLRTLFAPFRQIDAGVNGKSLSDKLRALLDRTVSRVIGAMLRLSVMVAGCVSMLVMLIGSVVILFVWLVAPTLPIVGLVLSLLGWLPW